MRTVINWICLAVLPLSLLQPALAEDDAVSIIGGVSYNWKNEDFTISGKPFKPEFTTIDWSIIAAYKSAYIKVNFDQSIKDSFQIDNSLNGSGSPDNQLVLFGREDSVITFGYSPLDSIALFIGYARGATEGAGTGQISDEGFGPTFGSIDISILEKGPFIGASYSYYLPDSGSFNFSLAYARLDGRVRVINTDTLIATQITTVSSQLATGNVDGLSFSISWVDQFSEELLYNISLKSTNYTFDAPEVAGQDSFDFDDTYTALSIGLSKFF